ncbi:transposase, partial [Komagataeibacter oboediens]
MTGDTDDIIALRAALAAAEARAQVAELRATDAESRAASAEAQIAHLKHLIARMRQDRFGASSERGRRLLAQLELELEELETTLAEDAPENAVNPAVRATAPRSNRGRQPLRADLPRERVVIPAPTQCPCCGSDRLSKLGESVTETLEVIPRQFKVIQTVREKFTCRDCESITQPPAPFHPIARGRAGPW